MGSLFKSPSVPNYSPVTYVPSQTVAPQIASPAPPSQSEKSVEEKTDTQDESVTAQDVVRRKSRGRSSLILTSNKGVLNNLASLSPQRKNLLGE